MESKKRIPLEKKQITLIIYVILLFAVCFVHAYKTQEFIDFNPINGTYQNFNPVRRLLDGQVPYADFNDYLGLGHLLWGSIATVLWGGNFAASLSAFTFLTILSMAGVALILGWSIFRSWTTSLQATLLILVGTLALSNSSTTNKLFLLLNSCTTPGNSARMIRGAAPIIFLVFLMLGNILSQHWQRFQRFSIGQKQLCAVAYAGLLGGAIFSHSNDYGISSWLCFGLIITYAAFMFQKKPLDAVKAFFIYFGTSVIGLAAFVSIVTRGNFINWCKATFGTGGYQSWYYLSEHSYFIFDVNFTFFAILQAVLTLIYLFKLFQYGISRATLLRYGFPAALNMTAFCASNEYQLLSGGALPEMAQYTLLVTLLFEIIAFVWRLLQDIKVKYEIKRLAALMVISLSFTWVFSTGFQQIFAQMDTTRGIYFENLGGYMSALSKSIRSSEEFLNGKKVFSTYSSALEAQTKQFQPSGYDYIIHVLGNSARSEYLSSFAKKDFDYAVTLRKDFTSWESWI